MTPEEKKELRELAKLLAGALNKVKELLDKQ